MANFAGVWEDEENNRIVALNVEFVASGDSIEIEKIIPQQVTFIDQETLQPSRSVKVHGEKAQQMLERQFRASGKLEKLEIAIMQNASATA